jgi:two-component system phosphate regulon sensor histidine kinase PhoR
MTTNETGTIRLRFEPTDVAALLRSCLEPLIEQARAKGVELRVDMLGEVPLFRVDREKLAWAVTALVGNALRYVRVGEAGHPGGSVVVHLHHEKRERELTISVQDDGPGISKPRVHSLFERQSGETHTTALALSLMRDVVSAHGGRISVESRTDGGDHGTSISLILPEPR